MCLRDADHYLRENEIQSTKTNSTTNLATLEKLETFNFHPSLFKATIVRFVYDISCHLSNISYLKFKYGQLSFSLMLFYTYFENAFSTNS